MKRIFNFIAFAVLIAAQGCSGVDPTQTGKVSFTLTDPSEYEILDATKSKIEDYTARIPIMEEFNLVITDADDAVVYDGTLMDWSVMETMFVGKYHAAASYGEKGAEGVDKPFYFGETDFEIFPKHNTSVKIPTKVTNTIIIPHFGQYLLDYFHDVDFRIITGSGNEFKAEEGNALFIEAFRFEIVGTMITPQGKEYRFSKIFQTEEVQPRTRYDIYIDVNNVGGTSISVEFDNTITEIDLGNIIVNE